MESVFALEIIDLKNEIHFLKEENRMLKEVLQRPDTTDIPLQPRKPRTMSEETKRRWKVYHDNKERVQQELGPNTPWYIIKKNTDALS